MTTDVHDSPGTCPRILVVDDDAAIRELLSTMLANKGYEVQVAAGGSFAEQIIEQGFLPHLVLMDTVMPDQDGLTTLRRLQQRHPSIRVIMLTGITGARQVVEAVKLGAYEYVTKPFAPDELESMVAQCLAEAGTANLRQESASCINEELEGGVFSPPAPACSSSTSRPGALRPPTFLCSSWAKAVPAKRFSPG